ncbi:MAG: cell division protein FtsQ/DivIB, partial [Alphaproteobacteria bacterium]|nr:cell division protein FtsQ/DivIB [Alphaproteobacteria bacterium]
DPLIARNRLEKLPWIKAAEISRHYPDAVNIHIIEKMPFALWESGHGFYAVEADGAPIAEVDATQFKRLPLFYGDRPDGAADLVSSIKKHRAVSARVKAMQRVAGRRWNLLLDDGVLVKLPEQNWRNEISALERLIVDNAVLERDIGEIDLRSHDNYIFVLRHPAPRKNARGDAT